MKAVIDKAEAFLDCIELMLGNAWMGFLLMAITFANVILAVIFPIVVVAAFPAQVTISSLAELKTYQDQGDVGSVITLGT